MAKLTKKNVDELLQELEDIEEWFESIKDEDLLKWIKQANERKAKIKHFLQKHFFPTDEKGTRYEEHKDYEFKCVQMEDTKLDEAALDAVVKKMPEGSTDKFLSYTPKLDKRAYKKLPKHLQKIFNHALIIKLKAATFTITKNEEE